jgi:hypothetical protein
MRASQLQLLREQALLKQTAHIATHQLSDVIRDIDWIYQQYQVAENRDEANRVWRRGAQARFITPTANVSLLQALDIYLRSIRSSLTSTQNTASLLAEYNIALVQLEEAKGTLLDSRNIFVYNDPCTAVQRTVLRSGAMDYLSPEDIASPRPRADMPMPPVPMDPAQQPMPTQDAPPAPAADGAHWSPKAKSDGSARQHSSAGAVSSEPAMVAKSPAGPKVELPLAPQPPVILTEPVPQPVVATPQEQAATISALREQLRMPSGDSPRSVLRREATPQPEQPTAESSPQPSRRNEPQPQPLAESKAKQPSGPRLLVPVPAIAAKEPTMVVTEKAQAMPQPEPKAEPDLRISMPGATEQRSEFASAVRSTSATRSVISTRLAVGEEEAGSELSLKGPAASVETITLRAQPAEHLETQPLRVVRQIDRTANRTPSNAKPVWSNETIEPAAPIRR